MIVIQWAWHRFRPQAGWLPLLLLVGAVVCAVAAVLAVEWVRDDDLVVPAAALGLLMGVGLAQRPWRSWIAWLFIGVYGLLWTTIAVADLWPPLAVLVKGWHELRLYWLAQGAIFIDRMGGWLQAVTAGDRSQETVAFVFGLGLLTWLLVAYAGWSAWRQKRPLPGMSLLGIAVAVNSYFGAEGIGWTAAFMAMAGLLTGVLYYTDLEQEWQTNEVDYSTEIRTDLTVYAGVISLGLLIVALILPSFSISRLAQLFRQQAAVQQAEETLSRAFAGVRQPSVVGDGPGNRSSTGVMPRSYLLGNAPELQETVVMTAVVSPQLEAATHWRGLSYDIYTGRGWASSEERQENFAAGTSLPLQSATEQTKLEQSVHWLLDDRVIRYTLGLPRQFDQEVVVTWRGLNDLVRVQSEASTDYHVISQITTATAAQLQAATGQVPAVIQARYTQLPEDLPERIGILAQEVAGDEPTAFAQALALQTFLRQYRYSLNVPLPPRNIDPVAFFLFEQQAGYCDYFASAMTVMARSLGLPARMVIGYRAQTPDESGVQTVRQIDGHSWTEVYFADVGWVEFEPTAVFTTPSWAQSEIPESVQLQLTREVPPPEPIPIPEPDMSFPWGRMLIVALAAVGLLAWWWRQQHTPLTSGVVWVFGRLQQQASFLGQPVRTSQTPAEFAKGMEARLGVFSRYAWLRETVAYIQPQVRVLTGLFNGRQYGRSMGGDEIAVGIWRRLKRPLWLLRMIKWGRRL